MIKSTRVKTNNRDGLTAVRGSMQLSGVQPCLAVLRPNTEASFPLVAMFEGPSLAMPKDEDGKADSPLIGKG